MPKTFSCIADASYSIPVEIAHHIPHLERLRFVHPCHFRLNRSFNTSAPCLKELELSYDRRSKRMGGYTMTEIFRNDAPQLQSITLRDVWVPNLITTPNVRHLRTFHLSWPANGTLPIQCFPVLLSFCTQLEDVSISASRIHVNFYQPSQPDAVVELPKLKSLFLSRIETSHYKTLSEALALPSLEVLSLSFRPDRRSGECHILNNIPESIKQRQSNSKAIHVHATLSALKFKLFDDEEMPDNSSPSAITYESHFPSHSSALQPFCHHLPLASITTLAMTATSPAKDEIAHLAVRDLLRECRSLTKLKVAGSMPFVWWGVLTSLDVTLSFALEHLELLDCAKWFEEYGSDFFEKLRDRRARLADLRVLILEKIPDGIDLDILRDVRRTVDVRTVKHNSRWRL